jgi:ABC-type polysaccharide/polyol phosphate export permease
MMRVDAASLRWRRWRHRVDLLSHLARREFSMRYHDSTLGVLWFLAVPLAVFSGLLPWSWFAASVGSAAGLFLGNRDLVRQPGFSPAILVIVNALSNPRWQVGHTESSPPGHRAGTS